MRRLNINDNSSKKDTFGIRNCQGCPPYYDPHQNHCHIWKSACLINSSDPTRIQFEQDPKQENLDNKRPVDMDTEYCALCHIKRPPIFKMKTVTPNIALIGDDCDIFNEERRAEPDNDILFTNRLLAGEIDTVTVKPPYNKEYKKAIKEMVKLTGDKKRTYRDYGLGGEMDLYSETREELLSRKDGERNSVNKGVGDYVEPGYTTRTKTRSSVYTQNTYITRREKRRKCSIFLDKPEVKTVGFPHSMLIQEKNQYNGVTRRGRKIRTKLFKKYEPQLEAL
tara:strand:+ start:199 stop:1038 length:840 start_codon:yes stop_codon:yes gene_type:complete